MLDPKQILTILFSNTEIISSAETLVDFNLEVIGTKPHSNIENDIIVYLKGCDLIDGFRVTISTDELQFSLESNDQENENFFSSWKKMLENNDGTEAITIELQIQKKIHSNDTILIYNSSNLVEHFTSLSNIELIDAFSGLFKRLPFSQVYFLCLDDEHIFSTHTISVIKKIEDRNNSTSLEQKFDRKKKWERINSISHFKGVSECSALPEDFEIIEPGTLSENLHVKFKECSLILSMAIVFDLASIEEDRLHLKLNGYKTFNLTRSTKQLDLSELETYLPVYKWIVAGGGLHDKIGLARNLISLNLVEAEDHKISPNVYSSILSGYKLYEKQNIKQYIDLRNKMADQLISFHEKASKIVDSFAGNFQKSALAVSSLYATLIVAKVISAGNPIDVFTLGTTILSFSFLLISLIYFIISRKDVFADKKRFEKSYLNMKSRNEDLLEKPDINRILNNDVEHQADLRFISEKLKRYTIMWITLLSIFALATIVLFTINYCQKNICCF